MRAFVADGEGGASLREWPAPVAPEGEVLVRPLLVGMCGTDLELIDATIDPAYVRYPLVLGHEWVGELTSDVASLGAAGTRVVVEGIIPCGACDECRRGASNLCETYDEIGFTRAGAAAALVSVPEFLIHPVAADVALADAVLVEPMAVVWRALTRLPLRPGLRVAVIGDGTIALLATHLVAQFDPHSVTVIARRGAQRDLARRAGAGAFVTEAPDGRFDLVLEAAGTADAVATALSLCARGAMVILLGLPPHGSRVELAPDDVVNQDLIIQGSFSYTRDSFADVVRRLNAGALRPSFVVTHRFTLDDVDRAVAALRGTASEDDARGKVVVSVAEVSRSGG